jgi:hypothetical protein
MGDTSRVSLPKQRSGSTAESRDLRYGVLALSSDPSEFRRLGLSGRQSERQEVGIWHEAADFRVATIRPLSEVIRKPGERLSHPPLVTLSELAPETSNVRPPRRC